MKTLLFAASLLALSSGVMAADIGVSVNIGQPGFYGRIDIGDYPQPRVVYAQPVIVQRPVRYVEQAPIYLRVPPGHSRNWSRYCRSYNACGQRVYFVQDSWYTNDYAPRYRQQHRDHHGRDDHRGRPQQGRHDDRGHDRGHGPDRGPDRGHGNDRDHDRGHGNGNGNGRRD